MTGQPHLIGGDPVKVFLFQFTQGVFGEIFRFGGKTDQPLNGCFHLTEGEKNIFRPLQFEHKLPFFFLDFVRFHDLRAVVRHRCTEDRRIHRRETALDGICHLCRADDRDEFRQAFRRHHSGIHRTGNENHRKTFFHGGSCESIAHFSAGTVGDEADRIQCFTGRSGSDQKFDFISHFGCCSSRSDAVHGRRGT